MNGSRKMLALHADADSGNAKMSINTRCRGKHTSALAQNGCFPCCEYNSLNTRKILERTGG